ncbi:MAG: ThuA domain-containing protein [Verrucomicrobiota bacterium]
MKLHTMILALALHGVSLMSSFAAPAEVRKLLDAFKSYEQGKSVGELAATRQAVFSGINDPSVRATREGELLAFIASDANPQAKAMAIEWLGSIGSAASVPGLIAARATSALSAPVAAALERIPGPEAQQARLPKTTSPAVVSAAAAEVAVFSSALDKEPGSSSADALIAGAMRSSNELLVGAALRRIRAGAGSAALPALLLGGLAPMPQARQARLCDALATRPEPAKELRAVLTSHIRVGDPESRRAAILTLGWILQPEDLELLLDLAAGGTPPELATAATVALRRGTGVGINPALKRLAGNGGPRAIAAIDALAGRGAVEAVADLWTLSASQEVGVADAAFKALGSLINPAELGGLLKKLVAADGTPPAAALGQLTWNVTRRHPDPAAAADVLDLAVANAPVATKELLLRYATRIRPKGTPGTMPVNLPGNDDRRTLAPNGHEEIAYLDCGATAEVSGGGVVIRRIAGQAYRFGGGTSPQHTIDHGNEVSYEISGLDANADYVVGFSAWDADLGNRRQSFTVNGVVLLPEFSPLAYHADKPTCARIHLPLPRSITAGGKAVVTMACLAGPNAVISELWLLRRTATTPAKRVVILTGDDFPGHLWRETGPEYAKILRSDPRLEVTISESPAMLGSAVLASYDAVFLDFKNYNNRLPTAAPLWKNFEQYIQNGGGLVIAHFGCGALQEWNGFVNVSGRVWDPQKRGHDPYGEFLVRILQTGHPVTKGIPNFTTTDELYTCFAGDTKIDVLAEATSNVDKSTQPMAFVLTPGKGRVFNSPLGHNLGALKAQGVRDLYLNATRWATRL